MLLDEHGKQFDVELLKEYDNIILYGASTRNKVAVRNLQIENKVLYYVDSNPERCGNSMDGYEIHQVSEISQVKNPLIVSVLAKYVNEVLDKIQDYHVKCVFYTPEVYDLAKTMEQNEKIIEAGNRYRYIHVFPDLIFMRFFYEMIEEKDDIQQHLFFVNWYRHDDKFKVYSFICEKNIQYNNILMQHDLYGFADPYINGKYINKIFFSDKMEEIFEAADKIVLHSAYMEAAGRNRFSKLADKMGEKMCWISFGSDGYYKADNPVLNEVINKVKISYASHDRIDYIKQIYKIPIEGGKVVYCYITKSKLREITEESNSDGCVNILLGHSAVNFGNHVYGLNLLKKYRNENIKIYCPLSYTHTDADYGKGVIEKGKELFGDKFIPILDYMDPNEYYTFLQTMDVAVFPLTRLAAVTNLTYLNAIGKKIYMIADLCEEVTYCDIQAEDIEHIRDQSFKEFIDGSGIDTNKNRILEMNDKVYIEWKKLLEA